jgi:hypothetical protein
VQKLCAMILLQQKGSSKLHRQGNSRHYEAITSGCCSVQTLSETFTTQMCREVSFCVPRGLTNERPKQHGRDTLVVGWF